MTKNMLYWILGLITIAIAVYLLVPKKATSVKEKLMPAEMSEMPETYRSYENLLNGFETEKYIVEQIISSSEATYATPKFFNAVDSSLIILTNNYSDKIDAPHPWMDTYLKLNKKGQIIDSISRIYYKYQEILGYLIAKDHYSSWELDGDKSQKSYIDLSLDSSNTKEEMFANFSKHYHEAEIVFYRDYFDRPTKTRTHVAYLFKDEEWFFISQQDTMNFRELYQEFLPKPHYEKIANLQLPYDRTPWTNSTNQLELVHFQKTKYHKESHTGIFNPTGYTRRAYSEGIAYLNLKINTDTVPFKLAMNQPEKTPEILSIAKGSDFSIYYHESLDFKILNNGEGQLHIVRPKN